MIYRITYNLLNSTIVRICFKTRQSTRQAQWQCPHCPKQNTRQIYSTVLKTLPDNTESAKKLKYSGYMTTTAKCDVFTNCDVLPSMT